MAEKLNKLQIRAKVFNIIKSYNSEDDFASPMHIENLQFLNTEDVKPFALEILIRELANADEKDLNTIKYLLSEFATLDLAEEIIWDLLKNPDLPDIKKETYLNLLRALGGKIDINTVMNCMNDFASVVDVQTQELLQVATVNPEAQVDFLDFFLSLKESEQIQLITSLENDFPGDELANIISPCLRIKLSSNVKVEVVKILGNSKSYFAIKPLKNFIKANEDDNLKKLALKALNVLQTSGVAIDDVEKTNLRESEVCKNSSFYKAYLSQIDGCGNQGLIFSRITSNDKIVMFSVVINTTDGIMDCFGLQDITATEFQKVISRFKDNDLVVPISAEIAKGILLKAENINDLSGAVLPYEYICWSIYSCDISPVEIDYDILKLEEIKEFDNEMYNLIYDTGVFDVWFFEYDDNLLVQKLIDFLITLKNDDIDEIVEQIENNIEDIYYKVFNLNKLEDYSSMLLEAAHIFYLNKDFQRANILVNLSVAIKNGETRFLKDVLRRSILQHLANIVSQEYDNSTRFAFQKQDVLITQEEALNLLQKLEDKWIRMSYA